MKHQMSIFSERSVNGTNSNFIVILNVGVGIARVQSRDLVAHAHRTAFTCMSSCRAVVKLSDLSDYCRKFFIKLLIMRVKVKLSLRTLRRRVGIGKYSSTHS